MAQNYKKEKNRQKIKMKFADAKPSKALHRLFRYTFLFNLYQKIYLAIYFFPLETTIPFG